MEWLIGLLVGSGLNRDVAVNLVTDLLMTIIFSVVIAWLITRFRERSETKNSEKLLAGPYRVADQCIVNYLTAGRALVRAGRQADASHRAEQLAKFEKRLLTVQEAGQEFQARFARIGPGLTGAAFSTASKVSEGLSTLARRAEEMEKWPRELAARLANGEISEQAITRRVGLWLDFLEESAGVLASRSAFVGERRITVKMRPTNYEYMKSPTGQIDVLVFEWKELKAISHAIWNSKMLNRTAVRRLLG